MFDCSDYIAILLIILLLGYLFMINRKNNEHFYGPVYSQYPILYRSPYGAYNYQPPFNKGNCRQYYPCPMK